MKKKVVSTKSQTTIFIIVSVAIVIIVSLFFVVKKNNESASDSSFDPNPIKNYIDQCIKEAAEDSVYFIALQGGYYNKKVFSLDYFYKKVPYYWYDKTSHIPSLQIIEEEIGNYISDNVYYCINNFDIYKDTGYEFNSGKIKTTAKLLDNELQVNLNFPVTIRKGFNQIEYKNFNDYSVITNLKEVYESAYLIITEQEKNPDYVPLSYIGVLAKERNFDFEIINLDEGETIITLIYFKDSIKPLIYAFINKYEEEK